MQRVFIIFVCCVYAQHAAGEIFCLRSFKRVAPSPGQLLESALREIHSGGSKLYHDHPAMALRELLEKGRAVLSAHGIAHEENANPIHKKGLTILPSEGTALGKMAKILHENCQGAKLVFSPGKLSVDPYWITRHRLLLDPSRAFYSVEDHTVYLPYSVLSEGKLSDSFMFALGQARAIRPEAGVSIAQGSVRALEGPLWKYGMRENTHVLEFTEFPASVARLQWLSSKGKTDEVRKGISELQTKLRIGLNLVQELKSALGDTHVPSTFSLEEGKSSVHPLQLRVVFAKREYRFAVHLSEEVLRGMGETGTAFWKREVVKSLTRVESQLESMKNTITHSVLNDSQSEIATEKLLANLGALLTPVAAKNNASLLNGW